MSESEVVRLQDLLGDRHHDARRANTAGIPIINTFKFQVMAERFFRGSFSGASKAEDVGFFQWRWGALKPRNQRFLDLMQEIKQNGVIHKPVEGYKLQTKWLIYDGHHRVAIAHAKGDKTILATPMELDPLAQDGIDLQPVYDAYKLCGPVYNTLPGKQSKRDSVVRLRIVLEEIAKVPGDMLLDLGCNDGYFGVALGCRDFKVTFVDHSKRALNVVRAKIEAIAGKVASRHSEATVCRADIVQFVEKSKDKWSVVLLLDVLNLLLAKHGLNRVFRFLETLIDRSEFLILTGGKWPRTRQFGFTERHLLDVLYKSGKRLKYLGRDNDGKQRGREIFSIS